MRGIGLPVARLVEGESIVLRLQPPDLPVDGVWSFHVVLRWEDRCRLLVRTRLSMRVPGGRSRRQERSDPGK